MKLIPCILICLVFGYGICSELNGTRVIQRESEEQRLYYCIPRICPKNYHAFLCMATDPANPGKDDCIPCDENTFNPKETDTSAIPDQFPVDLVCRKPDCNCGPEGFIVNKHECNVTGAQKSCICNANKGYCGDDYKNCVKWNGKESDIREGYELTPKCSIKKCEEGYSKPYPGYGACEKDTNNSTTTQPTTPDVHHNSTEVNNTTPSVNKDKNGGLDLNILIIAVPLLIVIVVIIVVVAIVYRRRRGRNNANPLHGDEEQNLGLSPNGQRMEPQLPNGREGSEPLTNGQGMVDTAC